MSFIHDMAIEQVGCIFPGKPTTTIEVEEIEWMTTFGRAVIREFVKRVNATAERKMEQTGKLEGAHYAAMQIELKAINNETA